MFFFHTSHVRRVEVGNYVVITYKASQMQGYTFTDNAFVFRASWPLDVKKKTKKYTPWF